MKKLFAWAGGACVVLALAGACGGSGSDTPEPQPGDDSGTGFDTGLIVPDGSVNGCIKKTCAEIGASCGPQSDGCNGVMECGSCTAPAVCGGGGASKCGNPNPTCTRKTCADLKAGALKIDCGKQNDGCGGVVDCGTCDAGEICGGGGVSRCGPGTASPDGSVIVCTPSKTTCAAGDCGKTANGCGKTIDCPLACPGTSICGGNPSLPGKCGGGNPSVDAGPACTARTCAQLGKNCGRVGNGCGALLNCNAGGAAAPVCPAGQVCGGGGIPNVCGPVTDAGTGTCTGLCLQQAKCDGGTTTTLTGKVYAPNGIEPLPNAVVYVPNGGAAPGYGVQPFSAGVACNRCGADVTGNPLVKTTSAFDGSFTLQNVPVGAQIPVVIQLGRWRRMVTIAVNSPCGPNTITAVNSRLPRTQAEFGIVQNNIPLTAIATGSVDTLECVMRKIGIADSEFTSPTGGGRIQMWRGDLGPDVQNGPGTTRHYGASPRAGTGATASWSGLYGSTATLNQYDQLIFSCNGAPDQASMDNTARGRVRDYLNAGGRLLASHYEYVWLNGFAPFSQTARWNVDQRHPDDPNPVVGNIDTSFAKGQTFAQWLGVVGGLSNVTPPRININVSRHDIDPLPAPPATGVVSPAQRWISVHNTLPNGSAFPAADDQNRPYSNYVGAPQHYTFNTPWGVPDTQQCGRVLFSDFHVSNAQVDGDVAAGVFPAECDNNPLTPQEKVIEFMLFDLGNCITPDAPPPSCTPRTTCPANTCGQVDDGCGGANLIPCPVCVNGQVCGGGGTPNQCGGPACIAKNCTQLNAKCGDVPNGCGGQVNCGGCPTGQACGAGGVPYVCAPSSCAARTCAQMGVTCGPSGDGCGNLLSCGTCPYDCKPRTCAAAGANCGQIGDNCGKLINCGVCSDPRAVCGYGGTPNVCRIPSDPH